MSTKICPKCGGTNIFLWLGGNLGMIYQCKDCGYRGPVVLEKNDREFKNSIK